MAPSVRERGLAGGWKQLSEEPGEPVQDEGSGDGDVQAGAGADHGDLDGHVEEVDGFGRDA